LIPPFGVGIVFGLVRNYRGKSIDYIEFTKHFHRLREDFGYQKFPFVFNASQWSPETPRDMDATWFFSQRVRHDDHRVLCRFLEARFLASFCEWVSRRRTRFVRRL
jgi:hypothetical protein